MPTAKLSYYEFILASLIMIMASYTIITYGQFSGIVLYLSDLLTALYALLTFVFLINFRKRGASAPFESPLFVLFIAAVVLAIFADSSLTFGIIGSSAWWLLNLGTQLVFFLMIFFSFFFSAFFVKVAKNNTLGALFAILGIILLWGFFLSGYVSSGFKPNDETLLAVGSVKAMLNGTDPYTLSLYNYFYSMYGKIGLTLLTTNNIASVMDYPALYFLSYFPFYVISSANATSAASNLSLYSAVSLLILIVVIAFSVKREHLTKPIFGLLLVLALGISNIASIVTYLMLAILILAYVNIDKDYVGVIIGLGFSIQQQIWIPLILLLIYSFNNYGYRKGARDVLLAAAVFLLVNGYFILQNPVAFFQQVLLPASGPIFPNTWGVFGYSVLTTYAVPLTYFSVLMGLVLIGLILIFVYFNEKRLIGLFSLLPLLFLQRGLFVYYTFFILFITLTLFLDDKEPKVPILKREFLQNRSRLAIALLAVLIVIAATAYAQHQVYLRNFNIGISNQTLSFSGTYNYSVYNSTVEYGKLGNDTIYVYALAYADGGIFEYGLFNSTIISTPQKCAPEDYKCLFNVNVMELNGTYGARSLHMSFGNIIVTAQNDSSGFVTDENMSNKVFHPEIVDVGLYSSEYYYAAPESYAMSAQPDNSSD